MKRVYQTVLTEMLKYYSVFFTFMVYANIFLGRNV